MSIYNLKLATKYKCIHNYPNKFLDVIYCSLKNNYELLKIFQTGLSPLEKNNAICQIMICPCIS